jgi:LysM repeat protein
LLALIAMVAVPVQTDAAGRKASGRKSAKSAKAAVCGKALTHKVVPGDNLWDLSRTYRVSSDQITKLNRKAVKKLKPGTVLTIRAAVKCPKKQEEKVVKATAAKTDKPAKASLGKAADEMLNELDARVATGDAALADKPSEKVAAEALLADKKPAQAAAGASDEAEDDSGDQYDEAVDDGEAAIDPDNPDEPKACDGTVVAGESDDDPDPDEVGPDGTDVGEDDDKADPDDKNTVADDEPEDLIPLPETAGFGFTDDGSACESYLNPITMMPTERKGAVNFYHKVKRNDNMWKIAKKYHVSVKYLQKLNKWNVKGKGGKKKTLRVGHRILVRIGDPKDLMEYRPFLKDWGDLKVQQGYSIKRSTTTFGRPWAMKLMLRSICELRRRVPDVDNVVVGDWSGTLGGPLGRHKSHQTGRDVDLGYFVNNQKCGNYFIKANKFSLDVEKTWELIRALLDTKRVQFIFMDWNLQKVLYEYAYEKGFPVADLDLIFQYPESRKSRTGIIRWARGHDDHIHVRFTCPPDDVLCR